MGSTDQSAMNIQAQAELHHALWLGLQLMVTTNRSPDEVGDWMFRLFRRQHLDKFLSSFGKLGLMDLPDAVACAKYHVMSNSIGGVSVEYMYEGDQKAWVRFRYPRWMYHGPTICGMPDGVSRGFLNGWYAYNGVSLRNPRLGFVCVSEDMTGEFGLCGYFKEYDHDLSDEERLQFASGELPPSYKAEEQPVLPKDQWPEERLKKANRNYAMDYIRNGLIELKALLGDELTTELGGKAARLIGLQYLAQTRDIIGVADGDLTTASDYLSKMFSGLGDRVEVQAGLDEITLTQHDPRIVRGMEGDERNTVLSIWIELWHGALSSFRQMKTAEVDIGDDQIRWVIRERVA